MYISQLRKKKVVVKNTFSILIIKAGVQVLFL